MNILHKKDYGVLSIKNYTFLLLIASLMGVQLISIDVGLFQISFYRILILFAPLVLLKVTKKTLYQHKEGASYQYSLFLFFLLVYSIFQLIWVNDLGAWIRIFAFMLSTFFISTFIGYYLTTKEDLIKALNIIEFFAFIFGVIAVYEMITGDYRFVSEINADFYDRRTAGISIIGYRIPISVFGNPNGYSMFLIFAIFISFSLSKINKFWASKLISIILTIFFVFLLISTQSRSGFIGLLIGISMYVLLTLKHIGLKKIFCLFVIVSVGTYIYSPWLLDQIDLYNALITVDMESSGSDYVRINLIKNGLYFLYNSLFLGVGLGNIEYLMANNAIYPTYGIVNIHNYWMEMLVSSGIFLFTFYMVVYLKNLWWLLRYSLIYQNSDMRSLSTCFFCLLMAFPVASLGSSSLFASEWFWSIMAVIMSVVNFLYVSRNNKLKAAATAA